MKKIFFPFFAILFLFPLPFLKSQELSQKFDDYINKRFEKGDFMGVVMIAKNGKPIYQKSVGFADLNNEKPNSVNLKFLIGSVSKQFTAALIMMLQEEGKLSTSDNLTEYFPDFKSASKITIKNLLNHTSGIKNYTDLPEVMSNLGEFNSVKPIIDSVLKLDLEFEPGTKMEYSNTGYLMLGEIVSMKSGKSFKEYLFEKIFVPLSMINSDFDSDNIKGDDFAIGYTYNDKKELVKSIDMKLMFAGSAGSITSTLEDMLKWDAALYGDKILSSKSKDEMFTPGDKNFGYGFIIDEYKNKKRIWHNGRIFGFVSSFMRYTQDSLTFIVFGNNDRNNVDQIAHELTAIYIGEEINLSDPVEITLDPSVLENYVGVYELSPTFAITITTDSNKIYAQATNQNKFEIFPESENKFFYKIVEAKLEFFKDENGIVNKLVLYQSGRELPAVKK